MRIGIICEGAQTDGPVLELLLRAEFPKLSFEILSTSKNLIFKSAGALIDQLLDMGCERVLVLWDLHPVGAQMQVPSQTTETDPCQMDQRRTLLNAALSTGTICHADIEVLLRRYAFTSLATNDVGANEGEYGNSRITLICFCESFDAVFLGDPGLLTELASSEIRTADAPPDCRVPERVSKPQEFLRKYFARGHDRQLRHFNKMQHNIVIAKEYVRKRKFAKLRKHRAYRRLAEFLEGLPST